MNPARLSQWEVALIGLGAIAAAILLCWLLEALAARLRAWLRPKRWELSVARGGDWVCLGSYALPEVAELVAGLEPDRAWSIREVDKS